MTKTEALQAMREGHRVTHSYYSKDEYIYMNKDGLICSEDGYTHGGENSEFWKEIQKWEDGWEIFVLHVIPYDVETHDPIEDYREDRLIYASFNYLHGKVQSLVGYDLFSFLDVAPKQTGIYDILVHLPEKKQMECKGFFWNDRLRGPDKLHGLVVSNDDANSIVYARGCFDRKEISI